MKRWKLSLSAELTKLAVSRSCVVLAYVSITVSILQDNALLVPPHTGSNCSVCPRCSTSEVGPEQACFPLLECTEKLRKMLSGFGSHVGHDPRLAVALALLTVTLVLACNLLEAVFSWIFVGSQCSSSTGLQRWWCLLYS